MAKLTKFALEAAICGLAVFAVLAGYSYAHYWSRRRSSR